MKDNLGHTGINQLEVLRSGEEEWRALNRMRNSRIDVLRKCKKARLLHTRGCICTCVCVHVFMYLCVCVLV